jgi:hypothetical protein
MRASKVQGSILMEGAGTKSRHNPDLQNRLAGVFKANTLMSRCTLRENTLGSVILAIPDSPQQCHYTLDG